MSDEFGKDKADVEKLDQIGRLVDKYAQSRSLGLLIPVAILGAIVALIIGTTKLTDWKPGAWWAPYVIWLTPAVIAGFLWLGSKLVARYEFSFYRSDGKIELETKKIPVLWWVVFFAAVVGATFLSLFEVMPVRWALTLALGGIGVFMLCIGRREKAVPLCIVLGSLLLIETAVVAAGVPTPFAARGWVYSFFVVFEMSVVIAGLISAMVVHIYNRRILRRIKELRPFSEQGTSKSD
jgi:uncharacterized membrane protein YjjB (DUF3815 family)